jgi:hypothetical protein
MIQIAQPDNEWRIVHPHRAQAHPESFGLYRVLHNLKSPTATALAGLRHSLRLA